MMNLEDAIQIANYEKPFAKLVAAAKEVIQRELEAGEEAHGWKLGQQNGKREWLDKENVLNILENSDLEPSQYLEEPTLKSPAQLEKLGFDTSGLTQQRTSTVAKPSKSRCKEVITGSEFNE